MMPIKPPVDLPFGSGRLPVLVSATFLEEVKAFLELVQNPQNADDAIIDLQERANVLEFKLDSLLKVQRVPSSQDCRVCGGAGFLTTEPSPNVCHYCQGTGKERPR